MRDAAGATLDDTELRMKTTTGLRRTLDETRATNEHGLTKGGLTTTGNDERTTTTGAGEEATRAAGSSCTDARTAWNTPLRCRRRWRRSETTSRRGGTADRRDVGEAEGETGAARRSPGEAEDRLGNGMPPRYRGKGRCRREPGCSGGATGGGDGDVGRRTGTAEGAARGYVDEEEGETGAAAEGDAVTSTKEAVQWRQRHCLLARMRFR